MGSSSISAPVPAAPAACSEQQNVLVLQSSHLIKSELAAVVPGCAVALSAA